MTYAALHTHCMYSTDGVGTVSEWVEAAKEKGLYGLGITDHGVFSSALELYDMGKKYKFPVVLGEEFYVVHKCVEERGYNHLTVWCKNAVGYSNLCKLSSNSFTHPNFYYKPRITYDMLSEHGDGLIVGSGCYIGEVGYSALKGNLEQSEKLIEFLKGRFGDDFYIEIMPAVVNFERKEVERLAGLGFTPGENLQLRENMLLLQLAKKHGVPFICSSDAHMPDLSMELVQKMKMWTKSKDWDYNYPYYLRSYAEFKEQWLGEFNLEEDIFNEGCENTKKIVDKCRGLSLEFNSKLPPLVQDHYKWPIANNKQLIINLVKSYGKIPLKDKVYVERLSREIHTLANNGVLNMLNYFLLLEDVCRFCRENGIMVGCGRGSAGGSLLAYALDITDVDPIKYNLSFERFINKARITKGTLPDIDLDVESRRRPKVLEYIQKVYGADNVAQFGTIHTMKFKLALRDTIRHFEPDIPQDKINRMVASLPWVEGDKNDNIEDIKSAVNKSKELSTFLAHHEDIYDSALKSIGQMRQFGVHAAAIAISPRPIHEFVPLAKKSADTIFYTQFPMSYCAKAGLIKYDLLGLNTLSDIGVCLDLIKEHRGKTIHPWRDIPLDDALTLSKFSLGQTATVFQFNTEIFQELLRQSKIDCLEDLVAINTLGRPGTFDTGMHKEWIERKKGMKTISYPHPVLERTLQRTLGIILYQEQVMESLKLLANYTDEEADDIRRAIGKKDTEVIDKYGVEFVGRATKFREDIDDKKATEIWELIKAFGRYSFNYSHAVAYTIIAYVCMYLKLHYQAEWWCAILRNEKEDDRRRFYYSYIKKFVAGYDINKSEDDYYIEYVEKDGKKQGLIHPPISSIKFIGKAICRDIAKHVPFKNFDDFYTKVDRKALKKHVVINMILGGMFKSVEPDKTESELIEYFYKTHLGAKIKSNGKPNVKWKEWELNFKSISPQEVDKKKMEILPHNDISLNKLVIGDEYKKIMSISQAMKVPANELVTIVGLVLNTHAIKTKNGYNMFFAEISNEGYCIPLTVFPSEATKYRGIIRKGKIIKLTGKVSYHSSKYGVEVQHAAEIGESRQVQEAD